MNAKIDCYINGTNFTTSNSHAKCLCNENTTFRNDFGGTYCSIPGSIWRVPNNTKNLIKHSVREKPRRVVMGLIVNHELNLTKVRFHQLASVVDIFVILESSISSGGDVKPLYFLNAFRNDGYLSEYHSKILYLQLESLPQDFIKDGWLAEAYFRNYMSANALNLIKGLEDDDLFLNFDADEIPKLDVIEFLKMHDGIPPVFQFNLRWTVYTFYWAHSSPKERTNEIIGGSTIGYLRDHCANNVYQLRNRKCIQNHKKDSLIIGFPGNFAGHHCSWCYPPEGIRTKLISAQRADKPRWGDFPEKLQISYISKLIQEGKWFDGKKTLKLVKQSMEPDFAPNYILKNTEGFKELLEP